MNLFKNIHSSWIPFIYSLAYKEPMIKFLDELSNISYQPTFDKVFKAFQMPVSDIKVVILGIEPYSTPGTATGLAYGVSEDSGSRPKLLESIKRELVNTVMGKLVFGGKPLNLDETLAGYKQQIMMQNSKWGTLEHWAEQGVLLLNTALTVETSMTDSHTENWKDFSESMVSYISETNPCIWMIWGETLSTYRSRIHNEFTVENYDRETIEEIPINDQYNYVIPGNYPKGPTDGKTHLSEVGFSKDGFHHINRILNKKNINEIIW